MIAADGPISVERFMALALQHPHYGYYRTKLPIGAAGDFITAPEIHQMFGELIGLWAVEVWQQMGETRPISPDRAWPRTRHIDGRYVAGGAPAPGIPASRQHPSCRSERSAHWRANA